MKTTNLKMLILAALCSGLVVGCGNKKSGGEAAADAPAATDTGAPVNIDNGNDSGSSNGNGDTVTFKPVSLAEMNSYVATHPLNSPTNIKININLSNVAENRYGGEVRISYRDAGQNYEGIFASGTGRNQSAKGLKDNDVWEPNFNYWFNLSGQLSFSGFFQDNYGAIVVIVDGGANQGDGQGSGSVVSGTVWYRNFAQTFAPQSTYRKCWFVYTGPYSCRSAAVINKSSLTVDGFTKLGTFSGLSKTKAFNLN
ncbi:MAG: hypothetical protein ACOYOK_00745 [Pseudobdellovibrionaceae bacterium]